MHVEAELGRHFDAPFQSIYDAFALFRDERVDLVHEAFSIFKIIGDVSFFFIFGHRRY